MSPTNHIVILDKFGLIWPGTESSKKRKPNQLLMCTNRGEEVENFLVEWVFAIKLIMKVGSQNKYDKWGDSVILSYFSNGAMWTALFIFFFIWTQNGMMIATTVFVDTSEEGKRSGAIDQECGHIWAATASRQRARQRTIAWDIAVNANPIGGTRRVQCISLEKSKQGEQVGVAAKSGRDMLSSLAGGLRCLIRQNSQPKCRSQ